MNSSPLSKCNFGIIKTRAGNSVICSQIWPKFEYIQDIMHFLLICKYEKGQINSDREKVETFSDSQLVNLVEKQSTKLSWLSMLPARIKEEPFKNKGTRVVTTFPQL